MIHSKYYYNITRELLRTTRKKEWGDTVMVPQELYDKHNDSESNNNECESNNNNDIYDDVHNDDH